MDDLPIQRIFHNILQALIWSPSTEILYDFIHYFHNVPRRNDGDDGDDDDDDDDDDDEDVDDGLVSFVRV